MPKLQQHIAAHAIAVLQKGCKEVKNNSAPCIDQMRRKIDADIGSENWCAQFVFSVLLDAWESAGNMGAFPLQTTSSTRNMIAQARNKRMTTNAPQIGDVFYRHRINGGHVGIIIGYSDDAQQYYTIEGNVNNRVGAFIIQRSELDDPTRGYDFINTSQWQAVREFSGTIPRIIPKEKSGGEFSVSGTLWVYASNPLALILLVGAGIWAYKKFA
jgi:hypothetical protein